MTPQDPISLIPYACNQAMAQAWADSGRAIWVRRNRNGSVRVSLNGGRALSVHDALQRIEAWYATRDTGK